MEVTQIPIVVLLFVLLGMNIAASIKVHMSPFYEPSQKAMQYLIIWILPLVGAIFCYGLAKQNDGTHSGKYADDTSLYDDGNVGVENADKDYFGGGTHHLDQ